MTAVAYAPQLTILNEAIGLRNPEDLFPGFDVYLDGRWFAVTAVLERTVVFDVDRDTKALAGFGRVEVDPESLHWREREPRRKQVFNGIGYTDQPATRIERNCSRCKTIKPITEFYTKALSQSSWCKSCTSEYNRAHHVNQKKHLVLTCPYCGVEFTAARANAKFCKPAHSKRFHNDAWKKARVTHEEKTPSEGGS